MEYRVGQTFRDYLGYIFIKTIYQDSIGIIIQSLDTDELYQKVFHFSRLEKSPEMTIESFCNVLKKGNYRLMLKLLFN